MIHGFGYDTEFTSKKIRGCCFIFLRHNKPTGHPCTCFCDFSAECSYFHNSSGISWHLPVESLERRTCLQACRWFSSLKFCNLHTSSERRSRPLGVWMAGAPIQTQEIPSCWKWSWLWLWQSACWLWKGLQKSISPSSGRFSHMYLTSAMSHLLLYSKGFLWQTLPFSLFCNCCVHSTGK